MCISDIGIIELEEMRFWAHHGCLESERSNGNLFLVDFRGELDMRKAAGSDKLEDTVNYGLVYDLVKEEMSMGSSTGNMLVDSGNSLDRPAARAFVIA